MCFLNYAYSITCANEQLYNTTMISNYYVDLPNLGIFLYLIQALGLWYGWI